MDTLIAFDLLPRSSTRGAVLFHAAIAQEAANTLPRACDSHRRLRHPSQMAHQSPQVAWLCTGSSGDWRPADKAAAERAGRT
ncbi:hypothetical protein OEZ86_004332 [Tetradesmus obliquus]|nr:hypothetical protein OEZ86_004332 [Tetradesmus obliquus]